MSENPYRLARDIRGIVFKTADLIAMKLGIEKTAMVAELIDHGVFPVVSVVSCPSLAPMCPRPQLRTGAGRRGTSLPPRPGTCRQRAGEVFDRLVRHLDQASMSADVVGLLDRLWPWGWELLETSNFPLRYRSRAVRGGRSSLGPGHGLPVERLFLCAVRHPFGATQWEQHRGD